MKSEAIQAMLLELDAERSRLDRAIRALSEMLGDPAPVVDAGSCLPAASAPVRTTTAPRKQGAKGGGTQKPSAAPKISAARAGSRVIDRTVEALRKAGKPMTIEALAKTIGHRRESLQQCLAGYVKRGVLDHTGRAEFGLPAPSRGNGAEVVKRPAAADDLNGGVEPRFSALHLPEPYRGGYRCSRCHEYHHAPEGFEGYCAGEAARGPA